MDRGSRVKYTVDIRYLLCLSTNFLKQILVLRAILCIAEQSKMQAVSGLVKGTLADYLKNLPIPDSFFGWFSLSCKYLMHSCKFIG